MHAGIPIASRSICVAPLAILFFKIEATVCRASGGKLHLSKSRKFPNYKSLANMETTTVKGQVSCSFQLLFMGSAIITLLSLARKQSTKMKHKTNFLRQVKVQPLSVSQLNVFVKSVPCCHLDHILIVVNLILRMNQILLVLAQL